MSELVDEQDLGSCAARRAGSNPAFPTILDFDTGIAFCTEDSRKPSGPPKENGCGSIVAMDLSEGMLPEARKAGAYESNDQMVPDDHGGAPGMRGQQL